MQLSPIEIWRQHARRQARLRQSAGYRDNIETTDLPVQEKEQDLEDWSGNEGHWSEDDERGYDEQYDDYWRE